MGGKKGRREGSRENGKREEGKAKEMGRGRGGEGGEEEEVGVGGEFRGSWRKVIRGGYD